MKDYNLVDGAVTNNMPGDILKEKGCRTIIGSNVTPISEDRASMHLHPVYDRGILRGLRGYLSLPPILRVMYRSINIEGSELLKYRMNDFDIVLEPNIAEFDMFDFHLRDRLIDAGRQAVEEKLELIKNIVFHKSPS